MAITLVSRYVKGRLVQYYQETYREGGKVKTRYLGSANPKRKPKGASAGWFGVPNLTAPNLAMGGFLVGLLAARRELEIAGSRQYPKQEPTLSRRPRSVYQAEMRKLDEAYKIDSSSREKWHESFSRLPKEMLDEYNQAHRAAAKTYHHERAASVQVPTAPAPAKEAAPASDPSEEKAGEGEEDKS